MGKRGRMAVFLVSSGYLVQPLLPLKACKTMRCMHVAQF